jgi:hypothetical protein
MNAAFGGPITSPSSRYSGEKSKNKDTILGEERARLSYYFFGGLVRAILPERRLKT